MFKRAALVVPTFGGDHVQTMVCLCLCPIQRTGWKCRTSQQQFRVSPNAGCFAATGGGRGESCAVPATLVTALLRRMVHTQKTDIVFHFCLILLPPFFAFIWKTVTNNKHGGTSCATHCGKKRNDCTTAGHTMKHTSMPPCDTPMEPILAFATLLCVEVVVFWSLRMPSTFW